MLSIPQIEFHITHVCNLACDGCTHYSNYVVKGSIPFSIGRDWLTAWSRRVRPQRFKLLGGEPAIHPELIEYVEYAAELWPDTYRTLTTNGLLLDRYESTLPEVLHRTQTNLYFTMHFDDPEYIRRFVPIARKWSKLSRDFGFVFEVGDGRSHWNKCYLGTGKEMLPFQDGKQRKSWKYCISKYCMQLHENRLWKCPCLAYIGLISRELELDRNRQWLPYLAYEGIGLDASDKELRAFLGRKDEFYCTMCPSEVNEIEKIYLKKEFK